MKNILRFLTLADKRNEARFNEFIKLYKQLSEELPVNIRRCLKESKMTVYPASNKNYTISFNQADVFWWSEKFKNEFLVIRPIDEIKKAIRLALIDVVDDFTYVVEEKDFEMSKLVEELLAEK